MPAGTVLAKIGADEAAKLDKDLKPVGAGKSGNKEGTIRSWKPLTQHPAETPKGS